MSALVPVERAPMVGLGWPDIPLHPTGWLFFGGVCRACGAQFVFANTGALSPDCPVLYCSKVCKNIEKTGRKRFRREKFRCPVPLCSKGVLEYGELICAECRHIALRSCEGKTGYPSSKRALQRASRVELATGNPIHIYLCTLCDLWHLSSVRPSKEREARIRAAITTWRELG